MSDCLHCAIGRSAIVVVVVGYVGHSVGSAEVKFVKQDDAIHAEWLISICPDQLVRGSHRLV